MQSQYKPGCSDSAISASGDNKISDRVYYRRRCRSGDWKSKLLRFDQSSPDKQWEYQSSDEGGKSQMVKAGTTQIVLDLGSDCGYGQNPPSGRRAEFHRMIRVARFDL